jgi:hypothetical protein
MSQATSGRRLNKMGISARESRNAALMLLAVQLPAGALEQMLGIHPATPTAWIRHAGGSQAHYAAALVNRLPQ